MCTDMHISMLLCHIFSQLQIMTQDMIMQKLTNVEPWTRNAGLHGKAVAHAIGQEETHTQSWTSSLHRQSAASVLPACMPLRRQP